MAKKPAALRTITFWLASTAGRRTVRGWSINRLFAVYQRPGPLTLYPWALTHRPTGCACGWYPTRVEAVRAAKAMTHRLGAKWLMLTDPAIAASKASIARAIMARHGGI